MLKLFKITGYLEAISAIVLFFIAMPMKYIWEDPTWVTHAGRVHGGLFVAYIILVYLLKEKYNWSWKNFYDLFCCSSYSWRNNLGGEKIDRRQKIQTAIG